MLGFTVDANTGVKHTIKTLCFFIVQELKFLESSVMFHVMTDCFHVMYPCYLYLCVYHDYSMMFIDYETLRLCIDYEDLPKKTSRYNHVCNPT